MSVISPSIRDNVPQTKKTDWAAEARCGALGLAVATVNMVTTAIFLGNLATYRNTQVNLGCAAIILPSMRLFGFQNYFRYLPTSLELGIGHLVSSLKVKIDEKTGIWSGKYTPWGHFYDGRLSKTLQTHFRNEQAQSIIDLGCGTGAYVKDLREAGFQCDGCDGNPDTSNLAGRYCKTVDLTQKDLELRTSGEEKYDWALSLEVGEHIPKDHEQTFLDNVARTATKGIVLSWAKKGQSGLGHVNLQNNDYIEQEMVKRGWIPDAEAKERIGLGTSPRCPWFRDTIMVFRPRIP